MKKIAMLLCAISIALTCSLPVLAAESSPLTGDKIKFVVIALVVAAVAIVATLIFTRKKK